MEQVTNNLSIFVRKASSLTERINEPLTKGQFFDIAQEAAKSYHALVIRLMAKKHTDREQLTKMAKNLAGLRMKQSENSMVVTASAPTDLSFENCISTNHVGKESK